MTCLGLGTSEAQEVEGFKILEPGDTVEQVLYAIPPPGFRQLGNWLSEARRDSALAQQRKEKIENLERQIVLINSRVSIWQTIAAERDTLGQTYKETLQASEDLHNTFWDDLLGGANIYVPLLVGVSVIAIGS